MRATNPTAPKLRIRREALRRLTGGELTQVAAATSGGGGTSMVA